MRRLMLAAVALAALTAATGAWGLGAGVAVTRPGGVPPVREAVPIAATAVTATRAAPPSLQRRARRIIRREQRSGVLRRVLGSAAPRIVQIGELRAGRRRIGATALLALRAPRRDVRATVPGYVPVADGYRSQPVRFAAVALRDLLVDVDLRRGTVIAVQPGPSSQTSVWSPA